MGEHLSDTLGSMNRPHLGGRPAPIRKPPQDVAEDMVLDGLETLQGLVLFGVPFTRPPVFGSPFGRPRRETLEATETRSIPLDVLQLGEVVESAEGLGVVTTRLSKRSKYITLKVVC